MLSFSFAFCNMELSVWHVMSENNANIKALVLFTPKDEAFTAEAVDGYVKKILKQLNKTYGIELRS